MPSPKPTVEDYEDALAAVEAGAEAIRAQHVAGLAEIAETRATLNSGANRGLSDPSYPGPEETIALDRAVEQQGTTIAMVKAVRDIAGRNAEKRAEKAK